MCARNLPPNRNLLDFWPFPSCQDSQSHSSRWAALSLDPGCTPKLSCINLWCKFEVSSHYNKYIIFSNLFPLFINKSCNFTPLSFVRISVFSTKSPLWVRNRLISVPRTPVGHLENQDSKRQLSAWLNECRLRLCLLIWVCKVAFWPRSGAKPPARADPPSFPQDLKFWTSKKHQVNSRVLEDAP